MHRCFFVFLSILFLLSICPTGYSQADANPYDRWIRDLSVKKDIRTEKLRAVFNEIKLVSYPAWCASLDHLRQQGPKRNQRYQLRLVLLEIMLRDVRETCPGRPPSLDLMTPALQEAYELEDILLTHEILTRLSPLYTKLSQHGMAVMHGKLALDIIEKEGKENYFIYSLDLYNLTYGLYHSRDYRECIRLSNILLRQASENNIVPEDTMVNWYQILSWNTLGLAYAKLNIPDSAFLAFDKAYQLAKLANIPEWEGIIKGNKGDIFYAKGQYDSAQVLLRHDYEVSLAHQNYDNAANSLQWLARIDVHQQQGKAALQKLREALQLLSQVKNANYLSNTLFAFTQAFTQLQQADSANAYMLRYLTLHDSIENAASNNQTEIIRIRMDNIDNMHMIKGLNREKHRISLIRNFLVILVILSTLLGYLLYNRAKLKARLRQQETLEGKRRAEAATERAIEQLEIFRKSLLEKNTLLEELQTRLVDKESSEEQAQRMSELSQHLILTEEDWEKFKVVFESVYPGFFLSLRTNFPDITLAEQRMAALSKLRLTVKESANLLGISPNSVYKTRTRLRQRLGLEQDSDLDPYFA